jgi:hypothetical protein
MQQPRQRVRNPAAAARRRRRGRWRAAAIAVMVVVTLGLIWSWLWYYTASIADRTLAGWVERETAAGRLYSCASQTLGGFPFRIEVRCADAVAEVNSQRPPFTVRAKDVLVTTQVWHPTLMVSDITGPLSYADSDQPPSLIADWSRAQVSVLGPPPDPQSVAFKLDGMHVDRVGASGGNAALLFKADHADIQGRIIDGSARNNPVVEAVLHVVGAAAPTLHPAIAQPTNADIDVVLRGFKDLSTQPWGVHFREMQAAGGSIEIKYLRMTQGGAVIVGTGTLTVNAQGKLDGLVRVAIVGVEEIVPLLGIDELIGRGVDRLAGAAGAPSQGLGALDRLVPGLSNAVRASANASVIENIKKMGQPTEIDHKPATLLPLRVTDSAIYLGMVPLGTLPPLF